MRTYGILAADGDGLPGASCFRGASINCAGDEDGEAAAASEGAIHGDVAAQLAREPPGDCQPEPESLAAVSFMVVHLEKFVEESLLKGGLDAEARVDHVDLRAAASTAAGARHLRFDAHGPV